MQRKEVVNKLRFQGLHCGKQSIDLLLAICEEVEDPEQTLARLIAIIKKSELSNTRVDHSVVEDAVRSLATSAASSSGGGGGGGAGVDDEINPDVTIIGAFDVNKFVYDQVRHTYVKSDLQAISLTSGATARPAAFRERFELILARTMRNSLFEKRVMGGRQDTFTLTSVGALKEDGGVQRVLGTISQPNEGEFAIEDLSDSVPINMSRAEVSTGLFTESCIVIAEGELISGVFHVHVLAMPPAEERHVSLTRYPLLGPWPERNGDLAPVIQVEKECDGYQFLFLSDVWLDRPKVMQGLRQLFIAYDDVAREGGATCLVFVLCGNFHSSNNMGGVAEMEKLFGQLGALISSFPHLMSISSFIFIPGISDPAAAAILPRPPLPPTIVAAFQEHVKNSTFSTNPCRIQFLSQEIIIMRDDICQKMMRFARKPQDDVPVWKQLARTLIDQAHLCPLPPRAAPLYWSYDHAMRLFPSPTLLVLADRVNLSTTSWNKCTVVNPGGFSSDLSFIVYSPSSQTVETCQIDEEE